MTKLVLDDISDLRAYERERDETRRNIIDLKKRRRIGVGPFLTVAFENRDTVRYQIQEMARAEKILTDEGIQAELDAYNPLIPDAGSLSATLFIELTSEVGLREWLPKLIGIERHVVVRIGEGGEALEVRSTVDADHDKQLTDDDVTAAVHYIHFTFTPDQVEAFRSNPVTLVVDHPSYLHETPLSDDNVTELATDLAG
jgi:Protein of unknown function (DUF3501)